MKKIKFLIATFIFFYTSFASTAKPTNNLVTDVKNTTIGIVDSTKSAVTGAVKTVDTSSNFKMIYSDLKDGVVALGQSLKVGAEHVYKVLVKQQIVKAVVFIFVFLVSLITGILCYKQWGKIETVEERYQTSVKEVRPFVFTIVFGLISFITFLVFIFNVDTMIMGFVNPEYGAIQDVIHFVQRAGNNTCQTCGH